MNKKILTRIHGCRISGFSFVKYPQSEIDQVILHLASGPAFEFGSKEFLFGPYEAYTLKASEHHGNPGIERLDAGWTVGMIDVVERQDWLEPAGPNVKTIGNNPTTHAWGAVGTAPAHASHTTIVTSSVTFVSDARDHQAMIYLAEYPSFVSFTTDAREMAFVRRAHGST
jgi:hypothetical protein